MLLKKIGKANGLLLIKLKNMSCFRCNV